MSQNIELTDKALSQKKNFRTKKKKRKIHLIYLLDLFIKTNWWVFCFPRFTSFFYTHLQNSLSSLRSFSGERLNLWKKKSFRYHSTMAENVGILAMDIYFPPTCVQQVQNPSIYLSKFFFSRLHLWFLVEEPLCWW